MLGRYSGSLPSFPFETLLQNFFQDFVKHVVVFFCNVSGPVVVCVGLRGYFHVLD